MEKRDKEMPYEVIIQERNKVDLYGNVVYYIYWFDKYGNDITNEWKFWSKGPKKKYDRVNRYLTDSWLKEYCQTAEQCRKANKPKIVMLDEEEDDFAKQKRDEFYAYVKHHCPGFEDKIEWEYFQKNNTMPWNLSRQITNWID